jgi:hypothetical protein
MLEVDLDCSRKRIVYREIAKFCESDYLKWYQVESGIRRYRARFCIDRAES